MASYNSITDRAFRIANAVGTDSNASPMIDAAFLPEDLFRDALREAVIERDFERDYTLTLADGRAALPSGVLIDKLANAAIFESSNPDVPTSYEPRFTDYRRAPHRQLNYATTGGTQFYFREAGGGMDEYDGDVLMTVVALPDVPTDPNAAIEMPETLADEVCEILARMMRGE